MLNTTIPVIGNGTESPSTPTYSRIIHVHETDKDGVVHFSNYYKIAEEAMYASLRELGYSFDNTDFSVAMIHSAANYYHPIKFADRIQVTMAEANPQRVKFTLSFAIYDSNKLHLANIQFTLVVIDPKNRTAIPLPESLRFALNRLPRG